MEMPMKRREDYFIAAYKPGDGAEWRKM